MVSVESFTEILRTLRELAFTDAPLVIISEVPAEPFNVAKPPAGPVMRPPEIAMLAFSQTLIACGVASGFTSDRDEKSFNVPPDCRYAVHSAGPLASIVPSPEISASILTAAPFLKRSLPVSTRIKQE